VIGISYYDEKKDIIDRLQQEAIGLRLKNIGLENEGEIFKLMLEKAFYEGRMYELHKK
jgi:hypothetical protein